MKRSELRPVVLLSRCIEHEACRYDGSMISSPFVKQIKDAVDFITVCPEMAIGLPVPREAIRIIDIDDKEALVYSRTGTDVTNAMSSFATDYLEKLSKETLHGAILKSRSPSCGIKDVKIYKTLGKSPSLNRKTRGFFGGRATELLNGLAIEDEGRLTNFNIREHFLTRIYTMADFDTVKEIGTMKALVDFQSRNKYLLMAYHQQNQKLLGKIVANHDHLGMDKVMFEYEVLLKETLAKPLRRGTNINMIMHLFGYFKKELSKEEKAYFLDRIDDYSNKKVPLSVLMAVIGSWVIRFEEQYLMNQTVFEPYPKHLLDVTDSGKGID